MCVPCEASPWRPVDPMIMRRRWCTGAQAAIPLSVEITAHLPFCCGARVEAGRVVSGLCRSDDDQKRGAHSEAGPCQGPAAGVP